MYELEGSVVVCKFTCVDNSIMYVMFVNKYVYT